MKDDSTHARCAAVISGVLTPVLSQSFLALAISLSVAYIFFLPEAAQVRAR
jgi:hypothetical protein